MHVAKAGKTETVQPEYEWLGGQPAREGASVLTSQGWLEQELN